MYMYTKGVQVVNVVPCDIAEYISTQIHMETHEHDDGTFCFAQKPNVHHTSVNVSLFEQTMKRTTSKSDAYGWDWNYEDIYCLIQLL